MSPHTILSTIYNNNSHNYWVVDYYKFAYEQITIYYLQFATYELGTHAISSSKMYCSEEVAWSNAKFDT